LVSKETFKNMNNNKSKLFSILIVISTIFIAGCGTSSQSGQKAQPGDYDGPPGGAATPKASEGDSPTPAQPAPQ